MASVFKENNGNGRCRIVLTGGPGGGKTTAADLFRREIGEKIVLVPESATTLFQGGFPRSRDPKARKSAQKAIYHVQRNLEDVQSYLYPDRVLLCDRGSLDGAIYWPGEPEAFFSSLGTTINKELERYDGVIFFESASAGNISIEGGNPHRIESIREAAELDQKLRLIWAQHHRYVFVPHQPSFFAKLNVGLTALKGILKDLNCHD